jgi:hypothetical protein
VKHSNKENVHVKHEVNSGRRRKTKTSIYNREHVNDDDDNDDVQVDDTGAKKTLMVPIDSLKRHFETANERCGEVCCWIQCDIYTLSSHTPIYHLHFSRNTYS